MEKYVERLKTFDAKVLNTKVYSLCGEDIVSVLEERGVLDKMTNEEVEEIIDYMCNKLEIPWTEYVNASLDVLALKE